MILPVHCLNRLLLTATGSLAIFLAQGSSAAQAQTNAAPSIPGKRYLLVLETSRPMEKRLEGVVKSLQDVLSSSLTNEFRPQDTLGIWTFNDSLLTGHFPLRPLSSAGLQNTIAAATQFARQQKYEKQAHFEKVLPTLERVIANSQTLTVLLLSSGSEDIHGTPFDEKINENYRRWGARQQQTRMPFVTLLRASRGKIIDYAVAAAPWSLQAPALPQELLKESITQAKPTSVPSKSVQAVNAPLIISGKKPEGNQTNKAAGIAASKIEPKSTAFQPSPALLGNLGVSNEARISLFGTEFGETNPISSAASAIASVSQFVENGSKPTGVSATNVPNPKADQGTEAASSTSGARSTSLGGTTNQADATQPPPAQSLVEKNQSVSQANSTPQIVASAPECAEGLPSQTAPPVDTSTGPGSYKLWLILTLGAFVLALGLFRWLHAPPKAARHVSLITRSLDRTEQPNLNVGP